MHFIVFESVKIKCISTKEEERTLTHLQFSSTISQIFSGEVLLFYAPAFSQDVFMIHPIFGFWFLVTFFGDEVTKIQKYYIIFVYILQGKMGNIKIPKTKLGN